ncbi:conserved hypothetical protein [Mucor ambiguus]|uniref:Alpha/beta hydrolase fold-3 domain-containing protein n=1 Tax=Mucor ambiguus TaxID=91626 RepID=A0A0C9M7W5_9FUNG|nr:conserved hypothetical protein [Mucor ambiguus]
MPRIRRGKRCNVEGCCLPSKVFCQPPSINDKDGTNYPSIWSDLWQILYYLPISIGVFFMDIYKHLIKQPKRPTWDVLTAATVALLHALRSSLRCASLAFWRKIMLLPKHFHQDESKYVACPFLVSKLNLPGILEECDAAEDDTRTIEAQWNMPPATQSQKQQKAAQEKVVLYLHGGGYCVKDYFCYLSYTERFTRYLNRSVFSISYRLAPETKFPGALYDAVQAYFHLIYDYGIKPHNIAVIGDSAGGGLAMALLIYLRDHQYPLPETSVLLSPWVDLTYGHPSWVEAEIFDYLPCRPAMSAIMNPARFYLGTDTYHGLSRHPYASPLFADHFDHLPPILIQSGGCETMKDEIRAFAANFEDCHATIFKHEEYEDMVHDFQAFDFDQSHSALLSIQKWIFHEIYDPHQRLETPSSSSSSSSY